MSLPTDLPHQIAERAEQPGFGVVLDRARSARRRRRTTIASGLAVAVAVGGVAFAVGGPGERTTDPARPGRATVPLPLDVRAVLDDDRLDLWEAAGSPQGGVAALWRGCDQEPCRFAVVTREGDSVRGVALGASFSRLTQVPGGWLLEHAAGFSRITTAGDRVQIHDVSDNADSFDVMVADTAVETANGWRLLRGDKLIRVPSPDDSSVVAAHVTPDGQLVVVDRGPGYGVWTTADGRAWSGWALIRYTERIASATVTGQGDHVSVVFLGDDADGSIPVVDVRTSHDAGASWSTPRGLDLEGADGVRNLSSLAVTPSGSTYVTTESHGLVRIDADGSTRAIPLSPHETSAFAVGDSVCVVAEAGRVDEVRCSDDDGTTWTPQSLPGFR